jgi:AcrB/AcrD/AcrF family
MKKQAAKKVPRDKTQNEKASSKPTPSKWAEMNRKQRREMMRKMQSEDFDLEVVHPHAAGIDIGNESHYHDSFNCNSGPRAAARPEAAWTEIERPLAIVMIGGLITSTLFTLLALPTFYIFVHRVKRRLRAGEPQLITS